MIQDVPKAAFIPFPIKYFQIDGLFSRIPPSIPTKAVVYTVSNGRKKQPFPAA
jgi:hypothetical protein